MIKMSNLFKKLSYYEFYSEKLRAFCSLYPSGETTIPENPIQIGSNLFPCLDSDEKFISDQKWSDDLLKYCKFLNQHNFGFHDNIGYLCPAPTQKLDDQSLLLADDVIRHLKSLYVSRVDNEKNHAILQVRSCIDDNFSLKLFARQQTGPQEAMDLFILYALNSNPSKNVNNDIKHKNVITTLGYKKKQESYILKFSDESLKVLKIGLFGHLAGPGEHLEPKEKPEIKRILQENREYLEKGIPVKIEGAQEIASRSAAEEAGIVFDKENITRFLVGVHDKDGRDPRYWPQLDSEGELFGYERPSSTVLLSVVVPCNEFPDEPQEPEDTEECAKSKLVQFDRLVKEFHINGKYKPAIPSHVENVEMVKNALSNMLNQINASN